jgi:hypothetical protein
LIDMRETTLLRRRGAILTLSLAVLAFAASPAGADSADSEAQPSGAPLTCDAPEFDVGTRVKGERISHTFVLRNPGAAPVTIAHVAPYVGVTISAFDRTIPAGGEGKVHAELDTTKLTGPGTTPINVLVEGLAEPALVLTFRFDVVAKLVAHPGYARWIFVQHEAPGTIGQTVYANDGADFEVVAVESPMPAIAVTYREATPGERVAEHAGRQWRILPTLAAQAEVGALSGFLAVHTTHPRQKILHIPVSGFVRPVVLVEPQRGDYGTIELAGPRPATFQVRNFATEPIAVTGAETDLAGVTARIEPLEQGRRYRVVVVFDPATMREGPFAGRLRITTDSQKAPVLTVDLAGTMVRRPAPGSDQSSDQGSE